MYLNIAIADTGYVGLSNEVLLSQYNHVIAPDIVQAKVDLINDGKSPIEDAEIERYLTEKKLSLTATTEKNRLLQCRLCHHRNTHRLRSRHQLLQYPKCRSCDQRCKND